MNRDFNFNLLCCCCKDRVKGVKVIAAVYVLLYIAGEFIFNNSELSHPVFACVFNFALLDGFNKLTKQ